MFKQRAAAVFPPHVPGRPEDWREQIRADLAA